MNLRQEKIKRENFLVTLWELHAGNYGHDVSTKEACRRIVIDYDTEGHIVGQYLYRAGLVKWGSFEWICLTPEGIKEAERIVESRYAEKEYRVLKMIYDMGGPSHMKEVMIDDLVKALEMDYQEVNEILIGLEERKGLISSDEVGVKMKPPGIIEIEQTRDFPNRATTNFPANVYNNTINVYGDNRANIQQGTQGSNQSLTVNYNESLQEILPKLAELINAVKAADFEDKDEVVKDLEKAHQLAQLEDPKSKWALIQSKLTSAKTGMEIVGFGYKSLPYWPVIWQYFFG